MKVEYIIEWLGQYGDDWVEGSELEVHQRLNIWEWVDNAFISWEGKDELAQVYEELNPMMMRRNIQLCRFKLNPMAHYKLDFASRGERYGISE
jgi:hypothetical protein